MSDLKTTTVEDWTAAVRDCAANVGPAMGLAPCQVLGTLKAPAAGLSGVAITLEGEKPHVLIGVLSNQAGRTAIARALFQMGPTESPNPEDETDAVGELANVLTGHVKAAMSRVDAKMRIGLPYAVNADAFAPCAGQVTLRVSFGSVPAALVVTLL
ncbi:MAG TPA: chemotaxis protein CheX [Polyangiales bacterium]|nr:chemotaxis protein CheX [Polyangiales bacterium]